jgi:60 kDa SS-A/Ro ribonucleoprotein
MGIHHLKAGVAPPTQREPARADQVKNDAGGYAFAVDDWTRLRRFLILGTEGGTYYASERDLTRANAGVVERLAQASPASGARLVREIVQISESGRAPKNDPAILALAIAAKRGDDATRDAARAALPRICRTGTHLYHFAAFVDELGGWGRGTRRAIAAWFGGRSTEDLAYQLVKYPQRDGWHARDLLRLSHARPPSPAHSALYGWACERGDVAPGQRPSRAELPPIVAAVEEIRAGADPRRIAELIRAHRLPREVVPTERLADPAVWEALLPHMGLTALIRNLATMTRVGLLAPMSAHVQAVCARISDAADLARARVHPIQVLSALRTYARGHGERGGHTWSPIQPIVDALDAGFYASFQTVELIGRPIVLAIDVSGSMNGGEIAGVPGLTPRVASAAMGLVTAAREPHHRLVGFSHELVDLPISPRMRLDDAIRVIDRVPMGNTDCALPMQWATAGRIGVEAFAVYTDSETWHGAVHPHVALQAHRRALGVAARLAVIGMTASPFTIADPIDSGMLDVVGFDAAAPALLSDFFRGADTDAGEVPMQESKGEADR